MASRASTRDSLAFYSIGLKLRALRNAKQLTLGRLAAQTGYSTALLSKIETDRMVPTFQTLDTICRVYGIGLGHFFCEPKVHSMAITRKPQAPARREHPTTRHTLLHIGTEHGKLVSEIIDFPPGSTFSVAKCESTTELTAYVIEGTLHVNATGSQEVLEAGDSIFVHTDQPIAWSAPANSPCRVLCVAAK